MKKLSLLFALICVSVMGWATQYCATTITSESGQVTAKLSCTNPSSNTYVVTITSDNANFAGLIGAGNYCNVKTGETVSGLQMLSSSEFVNFNSSTKTLTITLTSEGGYTPNFYTPLYLDFAGQQQFNVLYGNNNIEWPSACASCTDATAPAITEVEVGSITHNSAVLTITASDNEGGSGIERYIVKNGDTQMASSTSNVIALTGLTQNTTYNNIKVFAQDACNNESSAFAVESFSTQPRPSECIGAKGHFGNPSVKKVYYQIDYVGGNAIINLRSLTGYNLDFAEVQITGLGNYAMTADGNGGYTYTINSPTVNDEWYLRFLYSDASFGGNEMTAETQSASDANIIYYKVGACTSTKIDDSNMALSSLGASASGTEAESNTPANAIDGNNNTRWSSEWDVDPQDFVLDLGQRRSFNAIQFVWYTTYTRTFDLLISDDNSTWVKIKSVDRTLENADNKEETIQLNGVYAARYIKFHGTVRGAGYGHSFREIRVIYATTPVLTIYSASLPSYFCTIGTGYQIAVTAKDQLGNDYAVTSSYTVTPEGAGYVTEEGIYTPAQAGEATITVDGEDKSANITVFNTVSDNLAYNKTITESIGCDADPASKAVDGDNTTMWACGVESNRCENTGDVRDYDAYFTVDLGANYNINLIRIYFEAACSQNYKLYFSANNTDWSVGKNYEHGSAVQEDRIDTWGVSDLNASDNVRYIKFHSTKAATPYRVKIREMYVFGTEASTAKTVSASVSPASTGSVLITTGNPAVEVTEPVESGTVVTFTATPAEGYDFVNWTLGGVEVSTNPEYAMEITANTALVANFELHRDVYCRTIVKTNDNKTLYLSCSKVADNTYQIRVDGSAEARINGRNNFNFVIYHTNDYSNEPYSNETGHGWLVSNEGYGYIVNTFTANDYKTLSFGSHYFAIGAQGGGEFILDNNFPAANTIAWNSTCADGTAPVISKAEAEILNATDIQLQLQATDNWEGMLTYTISRAGADDIVLEGASGVELTQDVTGLTADVEYTFHVVVSDGVNETEEDIVVTIPGDNADPEMTGASLASSTYTTAVIAVTATDNIGVVRFHVVETTHSIDANYEASEGNITIEGLTHATTYNFSISALDLAGNESEPIELQVTTPFNTSINLALEKTCQAGYEDGNETEVASKVNDNKENTAWVTYANRPASEEWWYVDLGEIYAISNITTVWGNDYSTKYILQTRIEAPATADKADDAAWITIATVTDVTANSTKSTDVAGIGRYVRFRSITRSGECIRLKELRVFGTAKVPSDTEKPVMGDAELVSNTDSYAIISVAATDNNAVARYRVTDSGNAFDGYFVSEAGQITISGLAGSTNYTFVIKAVDFFNNESDNSQSVEVSTVEHLTAPAAACPAPTWDADLVKAMYSPTYEADCNFANWSDAASCTQESYGKKYIVGAPGYFGIDGFSFNCITMEKLHYDIWIADNATIRIVPIRRVNGNNDTEYGETISLLGQQWNSIDLDLSEGNFANATDWSEVYQIKIDNASNLTFWVGNAYFYREAAYVDTEAPTNASASVDAQGFYSVKITARAEDNSGAVSFKVMNGEEIMATGASATNVATTITVNGLASGTAYNFNVIAYDEAGNETEPVAVAATTKVVPAPAPAPVTSGKVIVPVYSDVIAGSLTTIHSGGWGEATQVEWLEIAPNDQVFYGKNFNFAGWHSWGEAIDATNMMFLHVDFYSTGMTQISVTPISPGPLEGVANCTLTPDTWTSVDVPLSSYSGIDMSDIFQLKFFNAVGGNEIMIDNVYFWQPKVATTPVSGGDDATGGWGTFSCAEKVAVPEGLTAYKATYEKNGNEEILNLTNIGSVIPANAGVLLRGAAGADYVFTVTDAEAPDMTGNVLVGCPERTDISVIAETNDIFCLRYSELFSMTGFFLYSGQYIPAGKAYLPLPKESTPNPAPRKVRFVLQNEQTATGIEDVQGDNIPCTKVLENGQLYIRRGDAVYTIQGARVK